jgi:transcriptional regulator with GAF, ATPase, and Fis domain
MRENEQKHIRQVLDMTGWRIRGKNGAAEILGLKPTTLESRMAKLGIRREGVPTK